MVIWSTLEASCPICARRVRLRLVGSGFAQGQDSDLLLRMSPRHVVQAEVHTCPRCRFSGYADDFLREIAPATARRFLEHVSPLLNEPRLAGEAGAEGSCSKAGKGAGAGGTPQQGTPLPDVQYYWAYRTATVLGVPPRGRGERLLRAYWCLRMPPSTGLPEETREARTRLYLGAAIRELREALASSEDPHLIYLVGELCRRNGNFRLAARYLRRYAERPDAARYLKAASEKLLAATRDRISRGLTMEEIFFDRTPDARDRI